MNDSAERLNDCLDDRGRWQIIDADWYDPYWHRETACGDMPHVVFFGEEVEDPTREDGFRFQYPQSLQAKALRACSSCPARESCLKDEMDRMVAPYVEARKRGKSRPADDEIVNSYGTRGGTLRKERKLLLKGPAKFVACHRCGLPRTVRTDSPDEVPYCPCTTRTR